jgi:radial spoke head protein 1
VDGIREGKGKYVFSNGDKYEGDFKANRKHGVGKLTYKGKGEYYGQWENGTKHGEGTYVYTNGDSYAGWWRFGKRHGKGTYNYSSSGMKLVGEWNEGNIIEGKWVFPNGTCFAGKFNEGKPDGKGIWFINNGNTLEGSYSQTKIPNEESEDAKPTLKLDWHSDVCISQSAWQVNAHENF